MSNENNVNVTGLPYGMTKDDLVKLPEMKKVRRWFIWAGAIEILSGIINLYYLGRLAEYEARGFAVSEGYMSLLTIFALTDLIFGILLLVKKSPTIAYIVGITGVINAVLNGVLNAGAGAGVVTIVLTFMGARQINKVWKEYRKSH